MTFHANFLLVSIGNNLHEMSNQVPEKNIINLLSPELAKRVVKVNKREVEF